MHNIYAIANRLASKSCIGFDVFAVIPPVYQLPLDALGERLMPVI
jgi:hypothetical protein